ncbi:hypothetical protein GCM10009623_34680 [Nocardioides aestuarii]|uniref:Phosphatase PAP2 family protein n=1 Tax=Nocardioides aestuarii TaxID=252231 RepID=A0ABW4TST4_9ACTN
MGFAVIYWWSVRTVLGREFGDAALRGAIETRGAFGTTVDTILDVVSVASLAAATAAVATIALVRLARVPGLVALGVLVASNVSTWLLKNHLLPRPDLGLDEYAPATLNSLPSGHSTAVFSAVVAVLVVLPPRLRVPAALLGGVVALVTAVATMVAGWHRAADSMAAFLLVGVWAALGLAVTVALGEEPEGPPPRLQWFLAASLGAVALGTALVLLLDALPALRGSVLGELGAFVAGTALVAAVDVAVLLVVLYLLAEPRRSRPSRLPSAPAR